MRENGREKVEGERESVQGMARRKACDLPWEGRGGAGSPCPPVPGMAEEGGGDARRHGCPCALSGSQKWLGIKPLCRSSGLKKYCGRPVAGTRWGEHSVRAAEAQGTALSES